MPHWKTHIEISKELNKYLNYNNEDFELFVFGSILPDLNNGYITKDISKIIDHKITHFSETEVKSYIDFSNKYKVEKNNPLIFGYYTHLFTDYFWNNNFYTNAKKRKIKLELGTERCVKQHDFKVYNDKFINNSIEITNIDKIIDETKNIKEIYIIKEDILKIKEVLDKKEHFQDKYKFYTEQELDKLKEDVINELKQII